MAKVTKVDEKASDEEVALIRDYRYIVNDWRVIRFDCKHSWGSMKEIRRVLYFLCSDRCISFAAVEIWKKKVYVNGHTSIYAYVYVYVYAYVYVHVHVYSV